MSRSVLQKEAGTNRDQGHRQALSEINVDYPEREGYSIAFEVAKDGDGNSYTVRVVAISPRGAKARTAAFALENVPVIREHLRETGALKALYEGMKRELGEVLAEARKALGVEDPLSRAEEVVQRLREILYRDDERTDMNPEKEWDSDTLEAIGELARDFGPAPAHGSRYRLTPGEMAAIAPHPGWTRHRDGYFVARIGPGRHVAIEWEDDLYETPERRITAYFKPKRRVSDHSTPEDEVTWLTITEALALLAEEPK